MNDLAPGSHLSLFSRGRSGLITPGETIMAFKESRLDFKMIDVSAIDPDPAHPRRKIDEVSLKGLANSIRSKGVIQPLIVQPADAAGRHQLIVGERRWRAAMLAGESRVPALVRACDQGESLEIQVFENMAQGVRLPLETREMAKAIEKISRSFESSEAAAEHFGRPSSWLAQATAPAKLTPKVEALLESGKISSCSTAMQLDKLARKNEAKVDALIGQLQEGEKLPRKSVDVALKVESGKPAPEAVAPDAQPEPVAETPAQNARAAVPPAEPGRRVNRQKVDRVARLLGLPDGDEEAVLTRLIDDFLTRNEALDPPF